VELSFSGNIIYWRGPSPFWFVPVPEAESEQIKSVAARVSYGWGVIPVDARVGNTTWYTALFPKDGRYLVPVKVVVQRAEKLELGKSVEVRLTIEL
jgi:hypothetical protein